MPSCKASLVHFLSVSGLIVIRPVGNLRLADLFDTDSSEVGSLVDVDVFVSALVGHVGARTACTVKFCRLWPSDVGPLLPLPFLTGKKLIVLMHKLTI